MLYFQLKDEASLVSVGDAVEFQVRLSEKQQPQAWDVHPAQAPEIHNTSQEMHYSPYVV